jgi:phage shock protein A
MGTFSRIRYVIAANMNALLEKAEDPEKLLRALIREMEEAGEDARMAVAELLAEQQHLERSCVGFEQEMVEWQERAEQAVEAGRDDLARAALKSRSELEQRHREATAEREQLAGRIAQLEQDMGTLKAKLTEARGRLRELQPGPAGKATPTAAPGGERRHERRLREALGRFDRLQRQVERLEARVRSYEVGGAAPMAGAAEPGPADPEIETELEALKARIRDRSDDAVAETGEADAK